MNKIEIQGKSYEILGTLEKINVADSFVTAQNKIGSGSGEAKLYIGYESTEINEFFNNRGFEVDCFLLKEDLIQYLNEIRTEHISPTQEYNEKDNFEEIWNKKQNFVLNLEESIYFKIKDQIQIQGSRIYVNSENEGYKIIRQISLPIISHLDISKLKNTTNDKIEYYFYLYSDYRDKIIEEEEEIASLDTEYEPFNPELISIDTKVVPMGTLIRKFEQGTINLNPDFQRNEVWTAEKKCQLIESLMLKIPLPMFYVSLDENGVYNVVDGLQRLSTIRDFILGKEFLETRKADKKGKGFKLQKLEFWGDRFNNLCFKDLPTHIENRLLDTEFTFTLINSGTPEVVKRNIFKRVNRGGEPLTDQEIRHALYSGKSTVLLKTMSKEKDFLKVTNNSIKSNRMLDKEFILRLLSFTIRKHFAYPKNGNMDLYLSDTLKIINEMPSFNSKEAKKIFEKDLVFEDVIIRNENELSEIFKTSMQRSLKIFGEHSFRKSYTGKRKTPINKALFEVWGTLLSQITEIEYSNLLNNKKEFLTEYINVYLKDYKFDEIISRNALKQSSVFERHLKMKTLLNKYI